MKTAEIVAFCSGNPEECEWSLRYHGDPQHQTCRPCPLGAAIARLYTEIRCRSAHLAHREGGDAQVKRERDAAMVVIQDWRRDDADRWAFLCQAYADSTDPMTEDAATLAAAVRCVRAALDSEVPGD